MKDSTNCLKGGRYYTWTAAMDIDSKWQSAVTTVVEGLIEKPHRGICPKGWHIPTGDEWNALFKDIGYAAQQAVGNVQWTAATNASGFSALPAGCYYSGYYHNVGSYAGFWGATEYAASYAYFWNMGASGAVLNDGKKTDGFSVRCLQD